MKAALVYSFDHPPRYTEISELTPSQEESIIEVKAVGIHPIVKALATSEHYSSDHQLPFIPGVDGVGTLEDGTRVYFGAAQHGTLAEKTVTKKHMCMPLPDELDSIKAAAIFNPGLSSWLALRYRAQLQKGETVLINGATGVAGRLAIQIAQHLGAGKIIATAKNEESIQELTFLGADVVVNLDQSQQAITQELVASGGSMGINIVLDYLWGEPTEIVLRALEKMNLTHTRFIQIGDAAGKTITLAASLLRSMPIELYGSGIGSTPIEQIIEAVPPFTQFISENDLHIKTQRGALKDIEAVWNQIPHDGCRFVVTP